MEKYRVVPMNADRRGVWGEPSVVVCDDDPDAIESARHLLPDQTVEVWDDDRLVGIVARGLARGARA